jgi:uncharacterized repeat protein (TIGR01451 family)
MRTTTPTKARIAVLALASVLLVSGSAFAAEYVVTNTNDAGPGSLRQAILDSNIGGVADVIRFNIPGAGPFVITVVSPLPPFTDRVTVDATTQPGYEAQPLIGTGGLVGVDQLPLPQIKLPIVQVFGNGLPGNGLSFVGSNNSTLTGLHVWGFRGTNVVFRNSNDATVFRNLIGANPAFGDPGPALRAGINLLVVGNNSNVRENLVANSSTPDDVLIISERGDILVEGNELVGTLRISSVAPSPQPVGLLPNRFIGENLIRDSIDYGLDIVGGLDSMTISNNTVRNNGTGGANRAGIRLTNEGPNSTRNNVLLRNIVTGNSGPGILVTGGDATSANRGNTITHNSIYGNGGIGIDLGGAASDPLTGDGQTLNDPGDGDDGGNLLINYPVIESATISGTSLILTGWSRDRTIEFFADPPASQGRTFIASLNEGSADDSDNTTGNYGPGPINGVIQGSDNTNRFRFVIPLPPGLQAGSVVTATATALAGSTSEFSGPAPLPPFATVFATDLRITKTGPLSVTPGTSLSYTLTVTNVGPFAASSVSVADPTPTGLTFVSNSGACTTPFPCALGTLPSGQSVQIVSTFAVPANYTTPSPIVNTATVSSALPELDPSNDTATATTTVLTPSADLAITKGAPLRRSLGANLEYTIIVTNNGPSDAPNATITDPTPTGLTFVSNSGACTTAFPCSLGPLPAGQSRIITTTFFVPSSYAGPDPIVNMATVSSTAFDPDLSNNSATASTAIGPLFTINVEITKAGPASVTPGNDLVYAITVTNNGTLDATDVTVTDPAPVGLTFVSNAGACTTPFPCALGTIPAGESRQITTTFAVPSVYSTPNPISNTSGVTTTSADQDPTDNQATTTTPVAPSSDVSVSKTGPASLTSPGTLIYQITVTNNGPSDAAGVTVADPTPSGVTFVSNTGACTTPYPCALGTVPAGQTRTIVTTFTVPAGFSGTILNTAIATTTAVDPEPGNNGGSATTVVSPASADLAIVKGGEAEAGPGDTISYLIAVTNLGPSAAQDVLITDPTPAGLTFVSNSGACTTPFPCSLGTLASGATVTITATYTVSAGATAGPIINSSTVSASTIDPSTANNTSTFTTVIGDITVGVADLALTKTASVGSVQPGGAITYVLAATNLGPDEAGDVTIRDATPPGTVFVSASPRPGGSCTTPALNGTGLVTCTWTDSTAVLGARSLILVVRVAADAANGTRILNTGEVTEATDSTLENNSASALTTVYVGGPSADIEVQKILSAGAAAGGPVSVPVGQPFTYWMKVFNHGPEDATGIVVADLLPASFVPLSAVASQGSFNAQTGVWTVGNLPQGGVAVLDLTVLPTQTGFVQNTLQRIDSTPVDPNASNDVSSAGFDVTDGTAGERLVAIGDVDGDGQQEIIVASGTNAGSHVRVFEGTGAASGLSFSAYHPAFRGGARVASCDVTRDGVAEIITGAGPGGGPHVRIWSPSGAGLIEVGGFFAYDPGFGGGVFVACGDVTGDGVAEIITGAGQGGGPHLRVFQVSGGSVTELASFFAYEPAFGGGVLVAAGDVTGDGIAEIITGAGPGSGPQVRVWSLSGGLREIAGFLAYDPRFSGGVSVAAGDVDGNGTAEIVTGAGPGGGPHVRVFSLSGGLTERASFMAYDPAFAGGVFVASGDLNGDGLAEIVTGPGPGGGPHVRVFSGFGVPIGIELVVVVNQAGSPSTLFTRYLAEGATGRFFDTTIALLNPGNSSASVMLHFLRDDGTTVNHQLTVPAKARRTVVVETLPGLASASFGTVVHSNALVVVDRTMTWGGRGYGSHAETALPSPSTTWYLAEGSTSSDFNLFYLLQNPNPAAVQATVRYLLPFGQPPVEKNYMLPPNSRTTLYVDAEGGVLASTDVSAVITADAPIIVERAMYVDKPGQVFAAGHESAGVTAPALEWFLAEGATGPFFDEFVLIANPNDTPAQVTAEYLLLGGGVLTKSYTVPANGRFTIWVDDEELPAGSGQKPLTNVAVSTTIRSINGVPVIVERAMWWPGPGMGADFWYEAHNSPGAIVTGTRWGLAEGELGGPRGLETYVLIANTSAASGSARVTLHFEDGTKTERTYGLAANSRTNVPVGQDFPEAAGKKFGVVVESLGTTPAQIVVERAMYSSAAGAVWAAGSNALGTRLQ